MHQHKFIFICGLHRSGTSLLYKILKSQSEISGLSNTGAIEDEGQHLQSIFKAANKFGGPGKFGFNKASYLDESSELINEENKKKLFKEWSNYWDLSKTYLIEKSPPNLVRTRFLQAMFTDAYFITLYRHPAATSLATKKWSKTSLYSLVNHWLICHNKYLSDRTHLARHLDLKYEDLVSKPDEVFSQIQTFLNTPIERTDIQIKSGVNDKYFTDWNKRRNNLIHRWDIRKAESKFEDQINAYNYSFKELMLDHD